MEKLIVIDFFVIVLSPILVTYLGNLFFFLTAFLSWCFFIYIIASFDKYVIKIKFKNHKKVTKAKKCPGQLWAGGG